MKFLNKLVFLLHEEGAEEGVKSRNELIFSFAELKEIESQ